MTACSHPSADQEQRLAVQFGCARFVWNRALAMKRAAWRQRKESPSCDTIKGMLPVGKDGELAYLPKLGWGGLLLKIDDKLKRRGARLVKIDRWFPRRPGHAVAAAQLSKG